MGLVQVRHQPLIGTLSRYRANAVNFDGTNDYLTRGAGFTGAADSKLISGSFWLDKQGSDGANERVLSAATTAGGATFGGFRATKNTANGFSFQAQNSALTNILVITSTDAVAEIADGWVHVLFSFDLANAANRHIYVNDAAAINLVTTYTDDTIDFTQGDWSVGAGPDGTAKLNGDLADLWVAPGVYIDFSVVANRRLFVTAAVKPVALGQDGSRPNGTAQAFFFSGATASWETNKGTGGGFTENGALTDAATSPSD